MSYDVAGVRGLFPSLGDGWIHFDPQAGMQIPDSVASAVSKSFRAMVSQPSGAYPAAESSRAVVAAAREAVADLVGASPAGVVLGPSREVLLTTLADAITTRMWLGSKVVLSRLDDEANLQPWLRVADRTGAACGWAEVDIETGELPTWQFNDLVGDKTSVVAVTAASSTLGTAPDIGEIVASARRAGALVVLDATNYAPYAPIDVQGLGVDVVIVSAQRWGGPPTAAMVFANPDLINDLRPVGAMSSATGVRKLEGENYQLAMLAGMVSSIDHLAGLDESAQGSRRARLVTSLTSMSVYLDQLSGYLTDSLNNVASVRVIGADAIRVPIVSFTVDGVSAESVVHRLADNGICALADISNRALQAIGVGDVGGAVTVGLGQYSTPYEVDQLARCLSSLG